MENSLPLHKAIESILFVLGEPIKKERLADILKQDVSEIEIALGLLRNSYNESGLILIENDATVMLGTSPKAFSYIEALKKDEIEKELSKASLETLAIILYKEKVSRRDIDYIRGVNSAYILRNLEVRGLIEKEKISGNQTVYIPTVELLAHLGVPAQGTLPGFGEAREAIEKILSGGTHTGEEV